MGGPQKLTLSDDLRAATLGELLDRAHDGPLELRDADGHVVAEIHGRWLTLGTDAPPIQLPWEPPSVTTEELLRRCREARRIYESRDDAPAADGRDGGERQAV